MTPTKYQRGKARARDAAIIWQARTAEEPTSWDELATAAAFFERLGRRFGLLREYRENGIL